MAATATSLQSSALPPAMGRPLPPAPLNTPLNGTSSTKSSSPSIVQRAPTSAPLASPTTTSSAGNGTSNSAAPRNRTRPRPSQAKAQAKANGNDGHRGVKRKLSEPHVRTTEYILRKFRNKPPSLIIHLHPTHFRFDQQDGTFGYNSPMRMIIEHLKEQTVPHDILEELMKGGVAFYDGCLIVEIHDHKTTPTTTRIASAELGDRSSWKPFSIHNHSDFTTPSPFVPYPTQADRVPTPPDATDGTTKEDSDRSMAPPDAFSRPQGKNGVRMSKVFTTVLHPTALSRHREISILATSLVPDVRSNNRRQSAQSAREAGTPLSAGPPTPLSSLPSTPAPVKGSNKRQKVILEEHQIHDFEADLLRCTEPPLFLEPARDFDDAIRIMTDLTDPLHMHAPTRSKGRKRTTAELAADEAQAAEDERFALIMDERLEPFRNGPGATMAETRDKVKDFQPDFSRFKALEDIKRSHEEEARQKELNKERDAALAASKARAAQEQAKRKEDEQKRTQAITQQQQQHRQHQQMQFEHRQRLAQMNAAGQMHPQMMHNLQQNLMAQASQAQQSSPVVNSHAPNHSSPLAGGAYQPNGQPMSSATSAANAGSPPRPTSVIPVSQPLAHQMVRQTSHQTSQASLSRNGTPQVASAIPQPIPRNVTPHHPMAHSSSMTNGIQGTPVMGQAMMHTPQTGQANGLTPEQHAVMQMRQNAMAGNTAQPNGQFHQSPTPNQFMNQMSPQQRQAFHAHRMAQQNSAQGTPVSHTQGQGLPPNMGQQGLTPEQVEYKKTIMGHQSRQAQQQMMSMQQSPHPYQQFRPPSSGPGQQPNEMAVAPTMSRNSSQFTTQAQNVQQNTHPPMAGHQSNGMPQVDNAAMMHNQQEQIQNARMKMQQNPQQQQLQAAQQIHAIRAQFMKALAEQNGGQAPPDAEVRFKHFVHHKFGSQLPQQLQRQAQQQHTQHFQHPGQQQMMMPGQGLQQGNLPNLHGLQMNNPMIQQRMLQQPNGAALIENQREAAARARTARMMQQGAMGSNPQGHPMGNNNMMQGQHQMMNGMNGLNGMPQGHPGGGMG